MADDIDTTQDQGTGELNDQQGLDADESQNENQNDGQQDGQQDAGKQGDEQPDASKPAEKKGRAEKKAEKKAEKETGKAKPAKAEKPTAKLGLPKPLVEVNETALDALSTALETVFLAASGNLTIAEATERPSSEAIIGIAELSQDEIAAEIESLGDPREKVMASVGVVNTLKAARRTIDAALVKLIGMAEHRHRQTEALVNVYELERLRLLEQARGE